MRVFFLLFTMVFSWVFPSVSLLAQDAADEVASFEARELTGGGFPLVRALGVPKDALYAIDNW